MEYVNIVYLRGLVGGLSRSLVADKTKVRFSLMTEYSYVNTDGEPAVGVEWHTISALESESIPKDVLNAIEKGDEVALVGRLRPVKYYTLDGVREIQEVVASELTIIKMN